MRVSDLDIGPQTGVLYYVMDLVLYKDGEVHTLADSLAGSVARSVVRSSRRQFRLADKDPRRADDSRLRAE